MTLERVARAALWCDAALLAALTVSGFWLSWFYVPTTSRAWFGDDALPTSLRVAIAVRLLHRAAGSAFIWIGLLVAVLYVARAMQRRDTRRGWITSAGVAFGVLAWITSFTGFLLPWNQLGLRAVTVGGRVQGLWTASFSEQIRFAIIDGVEISQRTLGKWFLTHAFVLPVWLFMLLLVLFRRRRISDASLSSESGNRNGEIPPFPFPN